MSFCSHRTKESCKSMQSPVGASVGGCSAAGYFLQVLDVFIIPQGSQLSGMPGK